MTPKPNLARGEFFLSSFDASLRNEWRTPVSFSAPQGGVFRLLGLRDGYVVVAGARDGGLFVAKFDLHGQLLWSELDASRRWPILAAASGDSFYVVGGGKKDSASLHVIRVR